MEKMRKDLSDPQQLLACLKELSEQSNRKKMLSYLNGSELTKILKALEKPSHNKNRKEKQVSASEQTLNKSKLIVRNPDCLQ